MLGTDDRLNLNRYITYAKPDAKIKTNFGDQYRVDANEGIGGQYPWNPGRFSSSDILNRAQARKRSLNEHLGFVDPDEPLDTQLFIGQGRFKRKDDYDFENGRPLTTHRPQDNPDFNPIWAEAYRISPTVPPNKRIKNPMPSASNPDPHGFIMMLAQQKADDTVKPKPSVQALLDPKAKAELEASEEPGTEPQAA